MAIERLDKKGPHRVAFERNKKRILKTKHICGICGHDVDKTLAYPHPLSPAIDHIIPVSKGGHASSMDVDKQASCLRRDHRYHRCV